MKRFLEQRLPWTLATLALVVTLALPWVVFADQVVNNIDTTIDPALETRTITAGGSTVVGFYIQPSNTIPPGDATGCNSTGSNPATVNLSVPAGVTASPSSLTFTECGIVQNVTFSSSTVGSHTISVASVTGGKPGSLWDTAPAAFTLIVNPPADTTPPTTTITLSPATPNGLDGWYVTNVHVTVSAADNPGGSGVAETRCVLDPLSAPASFDPIPAGCAYSGAGADVTTEGQHTIYAASKDNAGNKESPVNKSFKIDKTPPIFGDCPAGGPFYLNSGSQPVGPIGASDGLSGLNTGASTLSGSVDTSSIGTKSVTFTAVDNAGNSATRSCSYSVIYRWNGFFRPVDNPGELNVFNVAKAGSAIPVKFSLSGNQGLSIFATGYPRSRTSACDSGAPTDGIEETVTAGQSSLSYDPSVDQYVYVWKTDKGWAGTCRLLEVILDDGTLHTANFKFK